MKETPKLYYESGKPLHHSTEVTKQMWPLLQRIKRLEPELLQHERDYLNELGRQVREHGFIQDGNASNWAERVLEAIEARRLKAEKIASQKKALPNG